MATVTVELDPGEQVTVTCQQLYEIDDAPEPDEEGETVEVSKVRAIG